MSNISEKFFKTAFGQKNKETVSELNLGSEAGRQNLKLNFEGKLEENIKKIKKVENNLETIDKAFKESIDRLHYKIGKVVEKVRGAILAERGTSGAIYTTQIPITTQQVTNTTTTRIEDGIAFGVPRDTEEYSSELTLLKLKDVTFNNLYLKTLNKISTDVLENFTIESPTQNNEPIELTVNLNGLVKTDSSLVIDLKNHSIVEIYKNGEMVSEKSLKHNIIVPIDSRTNTVMIRSYPTIHRISTLTFNKIGYTELIYDEPTYIETKNITIDKDFSQIVIDTCDNSNDDSVIINYSVSINDEEWESFSPVMKHKALEKQSIITVDKSKTLNLYTVKGKKFAEGDYRFNIPGPLQDNLDYEHTIYLRNNKRINDKPLTIITQQDIVVVRQAIQPNDSAKLYVNGREVKEDTITFYKGINKIFSENYGELCEVNLDYLEGMFGSDNIYIHVYNKEIMVEQTLGTKYITLSKPEFEDSFDTVGDAYFTGTKPKRLVSTVKIKAELLSVDKKTVPYISRILLRGV